LFYELTAGQLVLTDASLALTSSATVPADSVNKAAMSAVDYGDFTAGSDGTCTLDADVVAAAEMADADHGDVAWSSGVAAVQAVQADAIVKASLNAEDFGDFTAGTDGTCTLDADVVAPAEMADADHGDISWSSGVASVDASTITAAKLADAVQDMLVNSFTAVAVPGPDGKTNVVTVTAKDMGGNTLAAYSLFECWIGDTAYSVPAAVAGEFTVTTGVEVQEITDKAHYLVMTDSNGNAVLTIEDDAGRTNALHIVSGGGKVTATTLLWDTP